MFSIVLAAATALWFALLYPLASRHLAVAAGPRNLSPVLPMALIATFVFFHLLFDVAREDGTAILDQGLTASNKVTVAVTGLTAIYLAVRIAADRTVILVPFARPYLPFTLLVLVDAASTAWSIVPAYTAYRSVELAVFYLATILVFDRDDVERRFPGLLAAFILAWLAAAAPTIVASLASGIVFSSAKNNLMPLVCAALMTVVAFKPVPRRKRLFALGFAGFVIAGSAASTGALLVALPPALMIASARPGRRLAGYVAAAAAVAGFVVLMLGLSMFPALLDLLSAVLQKPAAELANATGRATFWPTFVAATRDHVFGSGYSAGDRFLQLLISTSDLADAWGSDAINITSAHNMFLSAWAGTGVLGLCFACVVLGSALAWGQRLEAPDRRFVACFVLTLVLNGMTTPGIMQDFSVNTFVFVGVLAYVRVAAARRASRPAPEPGRASPIRRSVAAGPVPARG